MSLQFDKESHMAMSELYYIQQKAGRVIPPPKMDYLRKISEEYGFPVGAHPDVLGLSFHYGSTSGIQAGICLYDAETMTGEAVDQARQALKLISDDLNKVVKFYSREDDDLYWNQRYILENFDRALKEGWITIYYQCIARVETNKGSALEALARWIDPARGVISPGVFIPVLKKYHLLYKLDLYMVEQVCKEISIRKDNCFENVKTDKNPEHARHLKNVMQ